LSVADIYGAIEKVCEVNDFDLGTVLSTEIKKWLLSSDSLSDADVVGAL
jgi:hypothetical protein